MDEADRLHRRKAMIDQAKDQIRRFAIWMLDFRSKAGELVGISAALGRAFDQQAWRLVASGASEGGRASVQGAGAVSPVAGLGVDPPTGPWLLPHRLSEGLGGRVRGGSGFELRRRPLPGRTPCGPPSRRVLGRRAYRRREGEGRSRRTEAPVHRRRRGRRTPLRLRQRPKPQRQLPETMSGGVGLIDYDGDGWLDVYCVQGGLSSRRNPPAQRRPDRTETPAAATASSATSGTARSRT